MFVSCAFAPRPALAGPVGHCYFSADAHTNVQVGMGTKDDRARNSKFD
jgi:hypothetical protein